MHIVKRGEAAAPERSIEAGAKLDLGIPESLTVLEGSLEDLEVLLAGRD